MKLMCFWCLANDCVEGDEVESEIGGTPICREHAKWWGALVAEEINIIISANKATQQQ